MSPILSFVATLLICFIKPTQALNLCDEGVPVEGTLHDGNGNFVLSFDPPLLEGNTYSPGQHYNVTLRGEEIIAQFFLTAMDIKTGPVLPTEGAIIGPTCDNKPPGIVESSESRTNENLRKATGMWIAPEKRSGTTVLRWTVLTKQNSVFSADADSRRFYIETIIMPEHSDQCVVFEQVPWIGINATSSWKDGE